MRSMVEGSKGGASGTAQSARRTLPSAVHVNFAAV